MESFQLALELAEFKKKVFVQKMLEMLVHRSDELTPEVFAYFEKNGVHLANGFYFPIIFVLTDKETHCACIPENYESLYELLERIIHNVFIGRIVHYTAEVDGYMFCLGCMHGDTKCGTVKAPDSKLLSAGCDQIAQEFALLSGQRVSWFLFFGTDDVAYLSREYYNMMDILDYYYFVGAFPDRLDHSEKARVQVEKNSQNPQFKDARVMAQLAQSMVLALKVLDRDALELCKEQVYDEIFNRPMCAKHVVMYKLFSYINALLVELGENGVIDQNFIDRNGIYNQLTQARSEAAFRKSFGEFIQSIYLFFSKKAELIGDSVAPDRSQLIRKYIDEHISDSELTVSSVADTFRISPSLLSSLFKNSFSISPHSYINKERMNLVKHELANTTHTLEHICKTTGFTSISTMQRVFKKQEGMSLGRYRKYCQDFLQEQA